MKSWLALFDKNGWWSVCRSALIQNLIIIIAASITLFLSKSVPESNLEHYWKSQISLAFFGGIGLRTSHNDTDEFNFFFTGSFLSMFCLGIPQLALVVFGAFLGVALVLISRKASLKHNINYNAILLVESGLFITTGLVLKQISNAIFA